MKTIDIIKVTCIIFIVFASAFVAGCNGNSNNSKKADTVAQLNSQNGEGMNRSHGEMGNGHNGMDSTHRGMRHGPNGKDTTNSQKHN